MGWMQLAKVDWTRSDRVWAAGTKLSQGHVHRPTTGHRTGGTVGCVGEFGHPSWSCGASSLVLGSPTQGCGIGHLCCRLA